MTPLCSILVLAILCVCLVATVNCEIHDPLNIFCGSVSCYDILNIERNSTLKDVKKSYRKLSLSHHPDKNKDDNATEVFRSISKAYSVLTGNESRPLFDYYLDHPRDYFKVSGQHYMRNMPHTDVRVVIFFALLLISWFFRHIQFSKYHKAVKFLTTAAAANLPLKSGGTPQTLELHKRACELYDNHMKGASGKDKSVGRVKMLKDPLYLQFIDQVVAEVRIEGGYRKPEWNEFLLLQVVYLPLHLYQFAVKYHRRYISKEPLSLEDQLDMARERVGLGSWELLSEAERTKLLEMRIWETEVYEKYVADREAEAEKRALKRERGGRPGRGGRRARGEEDEVEDELIE